jgi:hypothetical protein
MKKSFIAALLFALAINVAYVPAADASYRARATKGGFLTATGEGDFWAEMAEWVMGEEDEMGLYE